MKDHEACRRRGRRSQVDGMLAGGDGLVQGGTRQWKASTFGGSKGYVSLGSSRAWNCVALVSRMGFFSLWQNQNRQLLVGVVGSFEVIQSCAHYYAMPWAHVMKASPPNGATTLTPGNYLKYFTDSANAGAGWQFA